MAKHLAVEQDLLSTLLADRDIHFGTDSKEEIISIGRLELRLGQPSGVSLTLGRVHAMSAVRRRRPVFLVPPRPQMTINRSAELETLRQSVIARHVVDLYGPDGTGKSTVAATLTHDIDLNHFPDGVIFATGHIRYPDLIQALFDSCYESDVPVKITLGQSPTYLGNLRVLVILDDIGLGPKQIDPVLDALQQAAVLIVGPDRSALGRGRALSLKGLPRQDAVALFGLALGRKLSSDEPLIVDQVCTLCNDIPLPIVGVAAQATQSKQTLTKLLAELQGRKPWAGPDGDPSVGPSLEQIVLVLDGTDRQLLTLMAAFDGPSVADEALRWVIDLPDTEYEERLTRLRALRLVHPTPLTRPHLDQRSVRGAQPRLALTSAFRETVRTWLVDDEARRDVVGYYATRLSRGDRLPGEDLANVLGAIKHCAHNGWLDHLRPLVRAVDMNLARLRWWAEWEHMLDLTRRAAQAGGDRALEAWAVHQTGSVLAALGEHERAFQMLRTALRIRQALDDQVGAAVTDRNLDVLHQLVPLPTEIQTVQTPAPAPRRHEEERAPAPTPVAQDPDTAVATPVQARRTQRLGLRLALLAVAVIVVTGTLALRFVVGVGINSRPPEIGVSWEFGDAWNSLGSETWTQQIRIISTGGLGDYQYYVNNEPAGEMFEVVLPLCEGASGTIRVESDGGHSAEILYEFDSPFCH